MEEYLAEKKRLNLYSRATERNEIIEARVFFFDLKGHATHLQNTAKHGNAAHLHEWDCSVQRRHQKVVEIARSVELLYDLNRHEWFFIEMNPRIQVDAYGDGADHRRGIGAGADFDRAG